MTKLLSFKLASALLVLFWFSSALHAQSTTRYPIPEEDHLGYYSIDSGPGLDTGCSFRSEGPLVINLPVPVTLNPIHLNSDGTIKKEMIEKLIENKVVSERAKIELPVWDVDSDANVAGIQPEINKVYFNGKYKYTLAGGNDLWFKQSFYVDIGEVRFGQDNIIKVEIDTANSGEYWCTAVDWVSITFDAAYPYVLAHGIDAGEDTWTWQTGNKLDDGDYCDNEYDTANTVQTALRERGVLCKVFFIDGEQAKGECAEKDSFSGEKKTGKHGTAACNAKELKQKIAKFLKPLKAKKVNIIAHSKGGLDSQELAKISAPEFEIATLSTLSTPHLGSVVSDMQLMQQMKNTTYILKGNDPYGYAKQYVEKTLAGTASGYWGKGPQLPGLKDLTTQQATAAYNAGTRGNVPHSYTIGADAGPKCSRAPTNSEIYPVVGMWTNLGTLNYANNLMRLAYQALCRYSSVVNLGTKYKILPRVIGTPGGPGGLGAPIPIPQEKLLTYQVNPLQAIEVVKNQGNDIVVSTLSANPEWKGYASVSNPPYTNHTTIKNGNFIKRIFTFSSNEQLRTNLE